MSSFYTTKEVAEKFLVKPETVRKWASTGNQPVGLYPVKFRRAWRWKKTDVDRVLGVKDESK
jgi:predicted site-specific integrase-resolvase